MHGKQTMQSAAAHLPVVEGAEAEGLPLSVVPQVRLKAKALNDRQEGLDSEHGRAGFGQVSRHMAAPLLQHRVDCCDAICASKVSGTRDERSCILHEAGAPAGVWISI